MGELETEKIVQPYSGRQWTLLLVLGTVNLLTGFVYSIQAPFYPAEAERKGLTASEYGMVFGCYELTTFIVCPIIGSYMHLIGPKKAFNLGVMTAGVSIILFGFLDQVKDYLHFLTFSFLLRFTEALGSSTVFISIYTFATCEFPTCVAAVFGIMETIFGMGLCIGPTLGATIYEFGGYTAPFAALGTALFAVAIITSPLMPTPKPKKAEEESDPEKVQKGVGALLKIPEMLLHSICTSGAAVSNGFLQATLEPHLRIYNLSPISVGLMFLIIGGSFALSAPLWGTLCDRLSRPKYVTLTGAICILSGFLLIGPASIIPLEPKFEVTCLGLVLFGSGQAAINVATFVLGLQDAKRFGFPDNPGTYSVVSGVWRSSLALGAFMGPSIAGFLYDEFGFRSESLFVVGLQSLLIVLIITFIIKDSCCSRRNYKENLIRSDLKEEILPLIQKNRDQQQRY